MFHLNIEEILNPCWADNFIRSLLKEIAESQSLLQGQQKQKSQSINF